MPTKMPRRVRKTYTRDRSHFPNRPAVVKLIVYIRSDQAVWLAEEEERRLVLSGKMRAPEPLTAKTIIDPTVPPVVERKGRWGKYSEMTREAIDLLIEYSRHAEFMAAKLRPPAPKPKWREGRVTTNKERR